MGLFGKSKSELCSVCGNNAGDKKLSDGFVCNDCLKKCGNFLSSFGLKNRSIENIKRAITTNENNNNLLNLFQATRKIQKYLEIDENNMLWKLPSYRNIIFCYDDIISFELLENGQAITKGGLGRAVVGGALFGGVGAIVGGVTGKKKIKQEINEYRIKIITKHFFYPQVFINFLIAGKMKSDSILYKSYAQNAQSVLSMLSIIQNSVSEKDNSSTELSTADEILKFKKLLDDGIITKDEFDKKKTQLLNL